MNDVRVEPRKSRAESKAETRKRLLDAARSVFMKIGYHGATLDMIAAEAGFTKGALYWHFRNKQAIFLTLIEESIAKNLGAVNSLLAGGTPDEIRKRIGDFVDGSDDREVLPQFGVELEIEARHDESFRAIHQVLIVQHEAALAKFLERYFEAIGETPKLPIPELTAALLTIFKGFALCRQNRPDGPVKSGRIVRILLNIPTD